MRNPDVIVTEIEAWNCDNANVMADLLNELEQAVGWDDLERHVDLHNLPTQDTSQIQTDHLWAIDTAGRYVATALDDSGDAFNVRRVEDWR